MPDEVHAPKPLSDALDVVQEAVELDRRMSSGTDVRLLWLPATGATWIRIHDGDRIHSFPVDPAKARDAFYHPFAYER